MERLTLNTLLLWVALQVLSVSANDTGATSMVDIAVDGIAFESIQLTPEEYADYQRHMTSPVFRSWYKHLTPLEVMLIFSEDPSARRRFSERLVEQERDRLARELRAEREYRHAWLTLYPGEPVIADAALQRTGFETAQRQRSSSVFPVSRYLYVIDATKCQETCQIILQKLTSKQIKLDLVFTNQDTTVIRSWAATQSLGSLVSLHRVSADVRDLMLRHSGAKLFQFAGGEATPVSPDSL